jgi:hypothetical protein
MAGQAQKGDRYVADNEQLHDILEQLSARAGDASQRPEEGREVRLFFAASAAPPPKS